MIGRDHEEAVVQQPLLLQPVEDPSQTAVGEPDLQQIALPRLIDGEIVGSPLFSEFAMRAERKDR